jgi:HTH-like domain
MAFVERAGSDLPLTMQTELLSLNRSSLYYQPHPPSAEEVQFKHRIDEIYTQTPFYGARKIAVQLQREGMGINRKTVGRYMREMGIAAIYPGPNLSQRNQKEGVYPYLLRHIRSRLPQSYLGDRYHVYPPAKRLDVFGRSARLVFEVCGKPGNSIRHWSYPLSSQRSSERWGRPSCRFAIVIKGAILPVRITSTC